MKDYLHHTLSPVDFETLVVKLCRQLPFKRLSPADSKASFSGCSPRKGTERPEPAIRRLTHRRIAARLQRNAGISARWRPGWVSGPDILTRWKGMEGPWGCGSELGTRPWIGPCGESQRAAATEAADPG